MSKTQGRLVVEEAARQCAVQRVKRVLLDDVTGRLERIGGNLYAGLIEPATKAGLPESEVLRTAAITLLLGVYETEIRYADLRAQPAPIKMPPLRFKPVKDA